MKVVILKTAYNDIKEAENYIRNRFNNISAAKKQTKRLFEYAEKLGDNPYMGAALSGKYAVNTDLRYIISSKHIIFYRIVDGEHIEVTRVLDGRQDYISILF